jgi:hypothetical protein
MALCAYLAMGVAMAQSGAPAITLQQVQHGAIANMTECQAVMAVTHGITRYLGAEEVARELFKLPARLHALMSLFEAELPF